MDLTFPRPADWWERARGSKQLSPHAPDRPDASAARTHCASIRNRLRERLNWMIFAYGHTQPRHRGVGWFFETPWLRLRTQPAGRSVAIPPHPRREPWTAVQVGAPAESLSRRKEPAGPRSRPAAVVRFTAARRCQTARVPRSDRMLQWGRKARAPGSGAAQPVDLGPTVGMGLSGAANDSR